MSSFSASSSSSTANSRAPNPSSLTEASATVDLVYQLSQLLNTGLDRNQLSLCIGLTECGVNPEALAACIKELRREAKSQKNSSQPQTGNKIQ